MTSKNLFFKLLREDLKRRVWAIALTVLALFIFLPIYCAIMIERYSSYLMEKKWALEQILGLIGPGYEMLIVITVIAAIVCGLSGFSFLHSRKKVDLYHSIPVRRETLFAVNYINGLLIYIIPYAINVFLSLMILQLNDFMNAKVLTAALMALGINTLFYCFVYTIVIIAVILTGNLIVSCLGIATFLLYGPIITQVTKMYFDRFYSSYYSGHSIINELRFLSPIGCYMDTITKYDSGDKIGIFMIKSLAITIILIAIAVFLYKKRPSEAAGIAMAFRLSRPIIKFLLVIPISLGGGITLQSVSSNREGGWFLFGLIFTFLIVYAIIETTYNFDIRSALRYKKQMLACALIIGGIACSFQFDLFHYDAFIPEKNKIESMSIAISGLDSNLRYFDTTTNVQEYRYNDNIEYQLENMELTDFDSVYAMAEMGIKRSGKTIETNIYDGTYQFFIKYNLNNGKEVYRKYLLNLDDSYEMMKDIYAKTEFKKVHYPIYQWRMEDIGKIFLQYDSVVLNDKDFGLDGNENKELSLGSNETKQLMEIYKEELNTLSLDNLAESTPFASMQIEVSRQDMSSYYIYPSFERTIGFLKDHGFDATKEVDTKEILQISVLNQRGPYNEGYIDENKNTTTSLNEPISYTDENQIAEILPVLIQEEYYYNNISILKVEEFIRVIVDIKINDYGSVESNTYYFKQGKIPDFVKEDIRLSLE